MSLVSECGPRAAPAPTALPFGLLPVLPLFLDPRPLLPPLRLPLLLLLLPVLPQFLLLLLPLLLVVGRHCWHCSCSGSPT